MKPIIHKINFLLWGLLLFVLPFTSLPITAKLLRSSMVAAPSIIFMILLFMLWVAPKVLKREPITISKPLFLFLLFAIISSLLAFFINIPIQKELMIYKTQTEGLITLSIGLGFYILISNFISSKKILVKSIQIITISMIPLFIWSGVQLGSWFINAGYPDFLVQIQSILSTSGNLYNGRVTGFAFEPSWYAHTLTIFYIPLWLGLTLQNISVFEKKIGWISFENVLLFFSIIFLVFTKSRIGLVSFAFMSIFLLARIHTFLTKKIKKSFSDIASKNLSTILVSYILILIYFVGFTFSIFFISKFDKRMENMLNPKTYQNQPLTTIANEFQFAERIMYWQAGWRVFNDYPIFGVGLGNSGFYFKEKLPAYAWALDEPRNLFYRAEYLPNNKNLWTKLLSETGILGFSAFIVWLIVMWSQANLLKQHPDKLYQAMGYIGLFALIAFAVEGFSIDSFALPYYWIIPAFISAVFQYLNLSPHISELESQAS